MKYNADLINEMILCFSPDIGIPVVWDNFNSTRISSKYQYAAFIGVYAGVKDEIERCRFAFSRCPIEGQEIIDTIAEKINICAKEIPILNNNGITSLKLLSSPVHHIELH